MLKNGGRNEDESREAVQLIQIWLVIPQYQTHQHHVPLSHRMGTAASAREGGREKWGK